MSKPFRDVCLVVVGLMFVWVANAAEVDSFTLREQKVADVSLQLNREVNARLQQAITRANYQANHLTRRRHPKTRRPLFAKQQGLTYCNQAYLYDAISEFLGGALIGELEQWAEDEENLAKLSIPFEHSVYQDFLFDETPSIAGSKRIASLLNVRGTYIGTDKLGHFFTEGRTYLERYQVDQKIQPVLIFGEQTEILLFGSITTGVYSFADLNANLNGFRFWNALLAHQLDPVTARDVTPYVVCENHQWQLQRAFDWLEYVDVTWDEGVNCNQFRNSDLLGKFLQRLVRENYCQFVPEQLRNLQTKYGNYFDHLINTEGFRVLPEAQQSYTLIDEYIRSDEGKKKPKWIIRIMYKIRDSLKKFVGNVPFPHH